MFVDITNPKSPLAVENLLTPYKKGRMIDGQRQPKEKITPHVCMDILRSTNYARNIKDMLLCIAELPTSEQAQFKDVVLATFSNREQPNDILILAKKLAVTSDYEKELSQICRFEKGEILLSAPTLRKGFVSNATKPLDDFSKCGKLWLINSEKVDVQIKAKLPEIVEIPYARVIDFQHIDCTNVKEIHFGKVEFAFFNFVKNLPPNLDFSQCDEIYLEGCDLRGHPNLRFKDGAKVFLKAAILPKDLDVSSCAEVHLDNCDLSEQSKLHFRENAGVSFEGVKNLPKDLDVSNCAWVNFAYCSLANQPHIRFKDGAKISLRNSEFWPENLDVSNCAEVNLSDCNLDGKRSLRFRDGAHVNFTGALNLPKDLDVASCAWVNLSKCDLKGISSLTFRNDAEVFFEKCGWFPKNLDFSMCSVVSLRDCNLRAFSDLKFRESAKVDLSGATHLPRILDFSQCWDVRLYSTSLENVQQLIFKNKKQMERFNFNKKEWKGEIVYADMPVLLQKLMNLKWR